MAEIWSPTDELVAVAYLPRVTELDESIIATTLPEANAGWAESGFVTLFGSGGNPVPGLPQDAPVVTVDCWAVKGKWALAFNLARTITRAFDGRVDSTPFTVKANYREARVLDGRVLTTPRRVRNDPSLFARVTFDLLLNWVEVPA